MKKTNFDRLLHRYLNGKVTEQERIKLEAFLDANKTRSTELELSKADEERLFQKITANMDNLGEIVAFRPAQSRIRSLFTNAWFRAAASLLLVCIASYSIWYFRSAPATPETIGAHAIEKIVLNDGTLVWLQKDSKLTYYEKKAIRHAELRGEALFEVAKDASRPFTIACGGVTVKVIGTSFSIKTGKDGIELNVLTGKVNLSSLNNQAGVDVVRNEKVIYTLAGTVKKIPMDSNALTTITGYDEYTMQFRNAPMREVLGKIEKKFDVRVSVADQQLGRCRITADFTDQSLPTTLQMLSDLLELEYTIDGNRVAVSGKGCP